MKNLLRGILCLIGVICSMQQRCLAEAISRPGEYYVARRELDSRMVQRDETVVVDGQQRSIRHRYVELATGLHRATDTGDLVECNPVIELFEKGAVARQTRHQVIFSANANDWNGAIDLQSPNGKRFVSRVLGLSYYDTASGKSVLIAELKDSAAQLFAPDVLVYPDCMDGGFACDLEYRNTLAGLEQNLVFRERIPSTPSEFGLANETTVIQLLTEFFDPPMPTKQSINQGGQTIDRRLDFGEMKIGIGKSFMAQDQTKAVRVDKQWTRLEDQNGNQRYFLIEQIPFPRIKPFVATLPAPQHAAASMDIKRVASAKRLLPQRTLASAPKTNAVYVAAAPRKREGFVLDYAILSTGSLTNYVFQGDLTYLITNRVDTYGTTVIEGGAIIKYQQDGLLTICDNVSCQTKPYRPAVFTSWQDDAVGEKISGSANNPVASGIDLVMYNEGVDADLKYLRFSYAGEAIEFDTADDTVSHCQFVKCSTGISTLSGELQLRNNLFYQCGSAFRGLLTTLNGEHLTINQSSLLVNEETNMAVRFTNTLLVAVTNIGTTNYNATNSNFIWLTNDPGVFQSVGGAAHYLANSSGYRDAGTTNINATLLEQLRSKTTYPPVAYSNVTFTTNVIFEPQAQRDTNAPDLGYHYEPLDFAFGGCHTVWCTPNYETNFLENWLTHLVLSFAGSRSVPGGGARLPR